MRPGAVAEDGDAEEKNCWIKLLFLFSVHTKSILVVL